MRLTPEKLRSFAAKLIDSRSRDVRLLAAYLTGSLVDGSPFVGTGADVDIVFIYNGAPEAEREILPLFGDVHFDVYNHDRALYEPPRRFRTDPWFGPSLFIAQPLYDPQHFLDFVQAAARSRFRDPDVAYARARILLEDARNRWFSLGEEPTPQNIAGFLDALYSAANIPAVLHGHTLSQRRVMADFPSAARRMDAEGLTVRLYETVVGRAELAEILSEYLPLWEATLSAVKEPPPEIVAERIPYFRAAIQAYMRENAPLKAFYPLAYTWTLAASNPAVPQENWRKFIAASGLENLNAARAALDAFLDAAEEALEAWGRTHGAI